MILTNAINMDGEVARSATYHGEEGEEFRFQLSRFVHITFIAATKNGRDFAPDEHRKLLEAGENYIRAFAEDIGGLYVVFLAGHGHPEQVRWLPYNAAVSCEATREELAVIATERREKAFESILNTFGIDPDSFAEKETD